MMIIPIYRIATTGLHDSFMYNFSLTLKVLIFKEGADFGGQAVSSTCPWGRGYSHQPREVLRNEQWAGVGALG